MTRQELLDKEIQYYSRLVAKGLINIPFAIQKIAEWTDNNPSDSTIKRISDLCIQWHKQKSTVPIMEYIKNTKLHQETISL